MPKIPRNDQSDGSSYRGTAFCIVSSLHDGMNLVAKEFVAAQVDEQGMLILSQFTDAATELPDALIINPYNIDQYAAALHLALAMSQPNNELACAACVASRKNLTCPAGPGAC